jgi:hypothetical protein
MQKFSETLGKTGLLHSIGYDVAKNHGMKEREDEANKAYEKAKGEAVKNGSTSEEFEKANDKDAFVKAEIEKSLDAEAKNIKMAIGAGFALISGHYGAALGGLAAGTTGAVVGGAYGAGAIGAEASLIYGTDKVSQTAMAKKMKESSESDRVINELNTTLKRYNELYEKGTKMMGEVLEADGKLHEAPLVTGNKEQGFTTNDDAAEGLLAKLVRQGERFRIERRKMEVREKMWSADERDNFETLRAAIIKNNGDIATVKEIKNLNENMNKVRERLDKAKEKDTRINTAPTTKSSSNSSTSSEGRAPKITEPKTSEADHSKQAGGDEGHGTHH